MPQYIFKLHQRQMAIANPSQDVLLTMAKSGVVNLIGREWYFVRVHDAFQVCLQHVQSLKETSKTPDEGTTREKPSIFRRLLKHRAELEH
ncbi:sulfate transporter 4.1, chloroplastic-like [Cornus florida]|uniref:sulfate transporter 4.1, chloroplastic-like n=1 Tax=Cornus florida TaxID=4283 RepID=UPI0028969EA8|nr:sulfate transporter 4.1, chloroplastic-like [Cornus florida]